MSNFMGPMAPPQAAPSQPPQLDIRTNPNQRERFRDFMRQNTRPNLAVPAMQQPMMPQAPMPMAPQAPRPPIPMAIRPNAPMMPPQPAPMPYGGNIDVFSPQYMNQPRPMRLEDGGAIPPRETEIRGQDHMLSYITPDEADILTALGGSGEAGPMGIPAFVAGNPGGASSEKGDSDSGPNADSGSSGSSGSSGNNDGPDDNKSGGGQDRSGMQSTLDSYQGQSAAEKAADFAKAAQAGKDARDQAARDLVARTFATSGGGKSLVGAPGSKTGFATTGKPNQAQINDALAAAKSLGMDISGSQTATDLGLNDTSTNAVEAVGSPAAKTSIESFADLTDLLSAYQTTETPAQQAAKAKAAEDAQLTGLFGISSQTPSTGLTPGFTTEDAEFMGLTDSEIDSLADSQFGKSASASSTSNDLLGLSSRPSTQTVDDPMAVARAMDQIGPKGIMDVGLINAGLDLIGDIFGLSPDPEAVRSDYENRAYSSLGMSPGTASAVLGTQTATGPVTGAIGGPRGFLGSIAFGPYSSGAAGMTGMTPEGKSTGAITGDQLADLANRNRDGILGGISGFFNDVTLSAASQSNVAVVDPATGNIVGAIDGKGRYTGRPEFNPNTYGQPQGDGPDNTIPYIPPVVEPVVVDDDGVPNVFGGMDDDSPYQPLIQNFTGDGREQYTDSLRMPVGYGDPRTGYIAPQAFSTAGFAPPRRSVPIGFFEDGGEVLGQAADRFLEALTAA